ncbi:MAG TPA: Gfo/Idh/MocA family oxidoreductase [Acidimicrobiales bacterium]|nr:Gfo/Idh/MocA family oxidoreductase [Acidimicrobiales bacterium]
MSLRVGVVGLGMMGRHHARVLQSIDGIDLAGAVDPDGDRYGALRPGTPIFPSIEPLIDHGIDACVVAVPTADHEKAALELATAGVHCLLEKPIAADVPAAERIRDAFDANGVVGAVGHIERYNAAVQALRDRLAAGELGDVYQIATRRQGPFPNRISDVGVILDLATHDIDIVNWVTSSGYANVSARSAYRSGRDHEDLVSVVGSLGDGTVASSLVNWLSPFKERVVIVTGNAGSLVADMLTADLTLYRNASIPTEWDRLAQFRGVAEGDMVRFAMAKPEPLVTELRSFLRYILGDGGSIVSMHEAVMTVRVAQAIRTSTAEGGSLVAIRNTRG